LYTLEPDIVLAYPQSYVPSCLLLWIYWCV